MQPLLLPREPPLRASHGRRSFVATLVVVLVAALLTLHGFGYLTAAYTGAPAPTAPHVAQLHATGRQMDLGQPDSATAVSDADPLAESAVAPPAHQRSATWDYCGDQNEPRILDVDWVEFDPPSPRRGRPWSITVGATLTDSTPILDGTQTTDVYWGWIKVSSKTRAFCEVNDCPIRPGPARLVSQATMPLMTPPGRWVVETVSRTADGRLINCMRLSFAM